jgi:hypothetical protein
MDVSREDYSNIGILGFVSLFLLAVIVAWKWACFAEEIRYIYYDFMAVGVGSGNDVNVQERLSGKIRKRHMLYCFLLMASFCDIPLYAGFIVYHGYDMTLYSFHKLQAFFMFAAYSVTISDWANVLFEIKEDTFMPFIFRKATLLFLNFLFLVISIINFIYCYTTANLQQFLDSAVSETDVLFMIGTPLILTVIMLRSGLKLSARIQVLLVSVLISHGSQ